MRFVTDVAGVFIVTIIVREKEKERNGTNKIKKLRRPETVLRPSRS